MSRQLKFRGLDVGYNVWRFGSLVEYDNGQSAIVFSAEGYGYGVYKNEVIPETVGQYVGLKDRHGVKIYEGDILEGLGCVVWGDRECRFLIDIIGERYEVFFDELSQNELEVIGNIHERSE